MSPVLAIFLSLLLALAPAQEVRRRPIFPAAGGGSAPPFIKACNGSNSSATSQTCVFGSNVTNTSVLYVVGTVFTLTTLSVSGCGATWTSNTLQANGATTLESWGIPSTGACTLTLTAGAAGAISVATGEYGPSTGGVDNMVNLAYQGFVATAGTINCPAITTGGSNEQVICGMEDSSGGGVVFTAGAGFAIDTQGTNFGWMIESQSKAVAGSVTATGTANSGTSIVSGSIAIKP